jgi:hypothetical protein
MMRAETVSKGPAAHAPRAAAPSVQELEDALYDILAVGVDPGVAPGTLQSVQLLLHEHARSPKSQLELLAFFEKHGLPTARAAFESPGAGFALPSFSLPDVEPSPAAISGMHLDSESLPTARPATRTARLLRWTAAAAALALVGAAIGVGYTTLQSMRSELAGVRAESAVQQQVLSKVTAEAQTLRATVAQTTTLAAEAERKSELLLRTYASPLALDPQ